MHLFHMRPNRAERIIQTAFFLKNFPLFKALPAEHTAVCLFFLCMSGRNLFYGIIPQGFRFIIHRHSPFFFLLSYITNSFLSIYLQTLFTFVCIYSQISGIHNLGRTLRPVYAVTQRGRKKTARPLHISRPGCLPVCLSFFLSVFIRLRFHFPGTSGSGQSRPEGPRR